MCNITIRKITNGFNVDYNYTTTIYCPTAIIAIDVAARLIRGESLQLIIEDLEVQYE